MTEKVPRKIFLYLLCLFFLFSMACDRLAMQRARYYYNNAKNYYDMGNYNTAIKECDNALIFDPLFFDVLVLKGMIYYQMGAYKSSYEWLRKAVMQKPNDIQLQKTLIDAIIKANQYGLAILYIKNLLQAMPNDTDLLFLYYYAHIKTRQDNLVENARKEINNLLQNGYDDPRMYCLIAELEILKGDLTKAKTLLLEHFTPHPVWRSTMLLLADSFRITDDFANVIEIYNAVAEKAEDKKAVREELAEVLFKNKMFSTAANILKEIYEQYPDETSVQQKFVDCLIAIKKFDDAISVIEIALQKDPNNINLKRVKIDILIKKGDLDNALLLAQSAVKHYGENSPQYLEFKNKIAEIFFLQKKYEEAKAHAREILQRFPNDAQARFTLCKIDLQTSSSISLVGDLRQLINEYPNNADFYYYLGLVHQKRNEEVMADKAFREALEKDPGHRSALLALAEKNFKLGSYKIIEKDIQNYFKIYPDDNETKQLLNSMRMNRSPSSKTSQIR